MTAPSAAFCTSASKRALRFSPRSCSFTATHLMTLAARPAQPTSCAPDRASTNSVMSLPVAAVCQQITDLA